MHDAKHAEVEMAHETVIPVSSWFCDLGLFCESEETVNSSDRANHMRAAHFPQVLQSQRDDNKIAGDLQT